VRMSQIALAGLLFLLGTAQLYSQSATAAQAAATININTADAATLSRDLVGIGMKRALAIVEYRQKFGPFKSADEMALVKGIGPVAIAKNRDRILVATPKAVKPTAVLPAAVAPKR
jgi:competence protein ComEA